MSIPKHLAELGRVLDLRVERDGVRGLLKLRGLVMCSDSTERRLWLVPAPKGRKQKLQPSQADVAQVFKNWTQFEASGVKPQQVRLGEPEYLGRVVTIGYRSDKWDGTPRDYEHLFERPPRLTRLGDVYRISGGGLRVTPRGVVG